MKKTFIILLAIFFLSFGANAAYAGHGKSSGYGGKGYSHSGSYHGGHGGYSGKKYHHGGYKYSHHKGKYNGHGHYKSHGHSHHDHWYDYGWEAAAIGLGTAIVGSAIINSYYREPARVVEHHTYYHPAPPPPCRVWVPGYYRYEPGGHYTYVPGHYE